MEKDIGKINIDRTPPMIEIKYSTKEITNKEVVITILANEEIKEIENWKEIQKGKIYEKHYDDNQKEIISIYDLFDNRTEAVIDINNIDKINPIVSGIEEGGCYNANKVIQYEDNMQIKEARYCFNPQKNEFSENFQNLENGKEFSEQGYYRIIVTDVAGNYVQKDFCIDKDSPILKMTNIETDKKQNKNRINKQNKVFIEMEYEDLNEVNTAISTDKIKIMVDNKILKTPKIQIEEILNENKIKMILENIEENGVLKIELQESLVIDEAGNTSKAITFQTPIQIDNIPPKVEVIEDVKGEKSLVRLIANESIEERNGWVLKENQMELQKEFPCNTKYKIPVQDMAGNITEVSLKVTKATEIIFKYMAHSSNIGWQAEKDSAEIAGEETIYHNPKNKIESILFYIGGIKPKDFIRFKSYVYHYWGEHSQGICRQTKQIYDFGYNPKAGWKTMDNAIPYKDGKSYIQFGGAGINEGGYLDAKGTNALPEEVAIKCLYGITGISMQLKDSKEYSIIYQIYIEGHGWQTARSDGEEAMFNSTIPFSGFRATVIPISEKNTIVEQWSK